jgi:phage gpG-like protein
MIAFTYTDNSEAVDKALANFQASLADETPALQAIADDFRALIARQFATEGRAEGTPWPPRKRSRVGAGLAPPSKRATQASPLLVRTGALRDSLIGPSALGHVEELEAQSLTLGSRLPYALFHQLGTRRMAARPLIVLSGERTERWVEIVRGGVEEKFVLLTARELGGTKL